MTLKRERWHRDPEADEQPDAGDVLAVVDADHGCLVGPILRVMHARPVRGREDEPHKLMLLVEQGHIGDLTVADVPNVFPAVKNGRKRKRSRRW